VAMTELELQLVALREDVAWPPTPDLTTAVQARVALEPRRPQRRSWLRARLARDPRRSWLHGRLAPALAALLVVLVAFGVLLAASPGVRATLRDWLGIGSVRITRVQSLPDISPARQLQLGRRATVAQANAHLGSPIATVRALRAPDAIYLGDSLPARVSQVYAARPGLPPGTAGVGALFDQIQGDATPFIEKFVAGGLPITPVRINGERGYFIGGRHTVNLPDELRPRVAGNTVVWLHDAVTYRLETKLGRAAAVRLAQSVG
jgi:hypothetical protein